MCEREPNSMGNPTQNRGVGQGSPVRLITVAVALLSAVRLFGATGDPDAPPPPQELYNDGTQKFRQGKLPEAEASLQSALQSQNDKVRVPALYNLGHVRVQEGEAELKKN